MKKVLKEFNEFLADRNVFGLALGVIVGATVNTLISSVLNGLLFPLINAIPGKNGISLFKILLVPAKDNFEAIYLDFGAVINAFITFIVTLFVVYLFIKLMNKIKTLQTKREEKAEK